MKRLRCSTGSFLQVKLVFDDLTLFVRKPSKLANLISQFV